MGLLSFLYNLYLRLFSLGLGLPLYIGGWKRRVIALNRRLCGPASPFLRLRLCLHAAHDFGRMLHGVYGRPIRVRSRDLPKLKILKDFPSLFLTAHFHHWELLGAWMIREGIPLLCAARPMAFPPAQRLLSFLRRRMRLPVVEHGIPRRAIRHLEQGGCFALLWDQRVSQSAVGAQLFGIRLAMDPLPPFLAAHRNPGIWFGVLLPSGTFRLLLLSPGSRLHPLSPDRLARRYHRVLEILIRRHPSWWYGMAHRRFRDALAGVSESDRAGGWSPKPRQAQSAGTQA